MRVLRPIMGICLALASHALAHGPQLQITKDANGKLITREVFLDEPYNVFLSPQKSAYVINVLPSSVTGGGIEWYARPNDEINAANGLPLFISGPGIAHGYGSTWDDGTNMPVLVFPAGSNFRIDFADGLKRWNGSSFVDPGSEQVQMFRTAGVSVVASAITSDAGPFAGMDLPAITAPGSASALDQHTSIRYRLLGDGLDSTTSSQNGVYMLSMTLSSTASGVTTSDTYHFILTKNALPSEVEAAVSATFPDPSVVQFVPEPGIAGVILPLCLLAARRRGAIHGEVQK